MSEGFNSIRNNLLTYLTILFSLVWVFVIGVDYINKHPAYDYAFEYFRYSGLCIQILLIGAVILAFQKLYPGKTRIPFNGLTFLLLGIVLTYLIIVSQKGLVNFKSNSADHLTFLGLTFKSAIQLVLIGLVCRSAGQFVHRKLLENRVKSLYLLDIGLGIMLLTFGLFLLGVTGFLNEWTVIILLFLMIFINLKGFYKNLKDLLFKSYLSKGWGTLGQISVYLAFVFIIINIVSVQSPFPSGFDSRNYYMNISNLVAEKGALISGYPPYNGSLLNSIGLLLFDQIELALTISLSGVILALLIAFRIAVDKLKFSKDRAAFLIAIIAVIPALVNQMYIELKVDFMMLFFQLLSVYLLFEIYSQFISKPWTDLNFKRLVKKFLPVAALLGILLGFGMGIKMINLFLVIVIFILIFWDKDRNWSSIAIICLGLMVFLFGGIDEISGLRKYHHNTGLLGLGLGATGLILLGLNFYFDRKATIRRVIFSSLVASFMILTMSPWVIKNIVDTKSFNPKTILLGSSPGPDINFRKMENNYKRINNQ